MSELTREQVEMELMQLLNGVGVGGNILACYDFLRAKVEALEKALESHGRNPTLWLEQYNRAEALEKENCNLKSKPTCVLSESGYMCSHCGTTLRQDNPDWSVIDGLEAQLSAMKQERDLLVWGLLQVRRQLGLGVHGDEDLTVVIANLTQERDRLKEAAHSLPCIVCTDLMKAALRGTQGDTQ